MQHYFALSYLSTIFLSKRKQLVSVHMWEKCLAVVSGAQHLPAMLAVLTATVIVTVSSSMTVVQMFQWQHVTVS